MIDCWDAVQSASIAELPDVLRAHAAALGLEGTPEVVFAAPSGDQELVLVFDDASGTTSLVMLPSEQVAPVLRDALRAIDGRVFAGPADLRAAQWDAAVLVLSALALELRDAAELAAWAAEGGSSVAAETIAGYWNRWSGLDVRSWSQLAPAITAFYAFRRAM